MLVILQFSELSQVSTTKNKMFAKVSFLLVALIASSAHGNEVKGKYCAVNSAFHPHESDNTKFYVCTNNELILFNCPADLVWSTQLMTCTWPQGGGTGPEVQPTPGSCKPTDPIPQCSSTSVTMHFAHQSDCTKFYSCSWGKAYLMNCPATLHFNPRLSVCDYPYRAGCICNK